MRQEKTLKRKVVSSRSPEEYERIFNETANRLAKYSPDIKDVFDNGNFSTVFTYEIVKEIPENTKERFELEGQTFLCRNCPYLKQGEDRRRKQWECPYSFTGYARSDQEACNVFYTDFVQGKIKPKGDDDDEEKTD